MSDKRGGSEASDDVPARALARAALSRAWPVAPGLRRAAVERLAGIVADPASPPDLIVRAALALSRLDAASLRAIEAAADAIQGGAIEGRLAAVEALLRRERAGGG
jgi:hypothetical protein